MMLMPGNTFFRCLEKPKDVTGVGTILAHWLTFFVSPLSLYLSFYTWCLTSKTSPQSEMSLLPSENRYRLRAALITAAILYFVVAGVYQFMYRTPYMRQFKVARDREVDDAMSRSMDEDPINAHRSEVFLPLWLILYLFYVFSLLYLLLFLRIILRARLGWLLYFCFLFILVWAMFAWEYFSFDLGDQPWESSTHNFFTRGAYHPVSGDWVSFEDHVASLNSHRAYNHEKKTTLVELVLSLKVTLLTVAFYIVMRYFPKPREMTPKTDSYAIEMQPEGVRDASDNV